MSKFWKKKSEPASSLPVSVNHEPVMEEHEAPRRQAQRRPSISSVSSSDNSSVQPPQRARTKPSRINPQHAAPPSSSSPISPTSPTSEVLDEKYNPGLRHPHHDIEAAEPVFEVFPQKQQAGFIRRHAFVIGIATVTVTSFLIIGLVLIHTFRPKDPCQLNWGCGQTDGSRS